MKVYWQLQAKMIHRRFKDAGTEPLFAYILILIGFVGFSLYLFYKTSYAEYIYAFLALTLTVKLSEKKKNDFLKTCFLAHELKKIRVLENMITVFPFLFFLLYQQCFLTAFLLLLLSLLMAFVNLDTQVSIVIPTPFGHKPFEFTVGFRNSFYLIIGVYVLAGIAVAAGNFNLGLFAIGIIFLLVLGFYTQPENEYYVWIHALTPKKFLLEKIKIAVLFSIVLVIPAILVVLFFYREQFGLILLVMTAGCFFVIYMIVSKYAVFPDEMNVIQVLFLVVAAFYPPLLLVLIPYFFYKSVHRLNSLLK
jgi:hypothetical protein